MKYFIDTEFIEGFKKPMFGKKRHFIDLISIGIKCEDGRTYYAISNEWSAYDANDWVLNNVIRKLPLISKKRESFREFMYRTTGMSDKIEWIEGKSNKQIAQEIVEFVNPDLGFHVGGYSNSELREGGRLYSHFEGHNVIMVDNHFIAQPEFWAYYADYDWVVFCSLFGTMMDLPEGFPMYCNDLKQLMRDKILKNWYTDPFAFVPDGVFDQLKAMEGYPKQENEHNALADAEWNQQLFNFLKAFNR